MDSLIWNYTATNSSNGSSVWSTAQYYSIPNSSIIYNSVSTSNSLRTYKFKVTKAKKVHIYCSGNSGSTYNWHSGTPFFDIWNERIGTHYTSGTYTPNSQATKEMDMSCEKDDIICIKYWYGTYQYGTCKVGITLYG